MKKLLKLTVMFFFVLISLNQLSAQEKLSDKTISVPSWLNKAIVKGNQIYGGHHIYADWTAYTSEMKTSRVKLGMLMTILDSDGSGTVQTYYLKNWAATTAVPLQGEWEKMKNTLAEILETDNDAGAYQIKNLLDPTDDQDAVTKIYVDNQTGDAVATPVTNTEMYAISSPSEGQLVFCTDCSPSGTLMIYENGSWISLGKGNSSPKAISVVQTGTVLKATNNLNGSYTFLDLDGDTEGTSTFQWYRADDASAINESAISGETGTTYTITVADVDKYIRFAVKPWATAGVLEGVEAKASIFIGPVLRNEEPVANSVAITIASVLKEGYNLTGAYSYADSENDVESGTTLQWYRADDNAGSNEAAISGATNATYTMAGTDVGKYIRYGVIPAAATGNSPGVEAYSNYTAAVLANEVPTASAVTITPASVVKEGYVLNGSYTYNDTEGNTESGTALQWYCADDNAGTNEVAISGAINATYTMAGTDVGKYIRYGVIPAAATGNSPGVEAYSNYTAAVLANEVPTASAVTITPASVVKEGYVLNGSYTYNDTEGNTESGTALQWYRADDITGSNEAAISGATNATYTMTGTDVGKYIRYGVTPAAGTGNSPGVETFSFYEGVVLANEVPTANSVTVDIVSVIKEGNDLNGSYTYGDTEGDLESGTTLQWYRADDNTGTNELAISGETTATYTMTGTDVGKYIRYGVTPAAGTGNSPGVETFSFYEGVVLANEVPTANSVTVDIVSVIKEGYELNANYTYGDTEGDVESGTIIQWYIADDNTGTNETAISGETGINYTMQASDVGKYIRYSVTPGAATGNSPGILVDAVRVGPVLANEVPTAASVNFTGELLITKTLTGTYTYGDTESDIESGTTFKWYRANDAAGTGATEITGATANTYILSSNDVNKYISFVVVPAASSGNSPGVETLSSYQGPIEYTPLSLDVTRTPFFGDVCENLDPGSFVAAISGGSGNYDIQWYEDDDSDFTMDAVLLTGQTSETYDPLNIHVSMQNSNHTHYVGVIITDTESAQSISKSVNFQYSESCVEIMSPLEGAKLQNNMSYMISWHNSQGASTYAISYSIDDGLNWNIISALESGISIMWTPSSSGINSFTQAKIKVLDNSTSKEVIVNVVIYPPITVSVTRSGSGDVCENHDPGSFSVTYSGGSGSFTKQWYENNNNLLSSGTAVGTGTNNYDSSSVDYYNDSDHTHFVGVEVTDNVLGFTEQNYVEFAYTKDCWSCGMDIAVNHTTTGGVAPEDKTVNYKTVSYDGKCWIAQNLGATNQASSAIDNTDESAGWYWQFSQKQGYVGSTSPWDTSTFDPGDWLAENDPCELELGQGWRVPSNNEWISALAAESWSNHNDAYSSVLKLHSAGYLGVFDGLLSFRGSSGVFWSSSEGGGGGHYFFQNSGTVGMYTIQKNAGVPLRCVRDN